MTEANIAAVEKMIEGDAQYNIRDIAQTCGDNIGAYT